MLAGADYLKMGYVSRVHSKNNQQHFVLGNIDYRPEDFAKQIDLKVSCLFLFLPLPVWPLVSCIVLSRPGV